MSVDRTTNALWILIIVTIGFILLGAALEPKDEEWIELKHESGGVYVIRKQNVIGYFIPADGSSLDPRVMYQGGAINTSQRYSKEEFLEMME